MYYYTDFNTFREILLHGTLRFKENTSSNDLLDTEQLYKNLLDMAQQKCEEVSTSPEQKFFFDMLRHNGAGSHRISLVACFTSKADSRLLWDAYTMNRKGRIAERYNGVCIKFNRYQLCKEMRRSPIPFDITECNEVVYGFDKINPRIEEILNIFSSEVQKLSKEKDQSQSIVPPIPIPFSHTSKVIVLKKCIVVPLLHLLDNIDAAAPFIKHSFWREECETRALLSIKKRNSLADRIPTLNDSYRYFDLHISPECIEKIILGPEFSEDDVEKLNSLNGVIGFSSLENIQSEGTGVITNR